LDDLFASRTPRRFYSTRKNEASPPARKQKFNELRNSKPFDQNYSLLFFIFIAFTVGELPVIKKQDAVSVPTPMVEEIEPIQSFIASSASRQSILSSILPVVTSTYSEYFEQVQKVMAETEQKLNCLPRDDNILFRIQQEMEKPPRKSHELDDQLEFSSSNSKNAQLIQSRKQPIPVDERNKVLQYLKGFPSQEVLIDKYNIDMTKEKFLCLKPVTWLNDEVINFYMNLLQERDTKFINAKEKTRSSHYFNSFFFTKLLENRVYNYSNVKRWTKKFDIFEKEKIFIPVNLNNTHWTMLMIHMQKKEIHYFDSLSGSGKTYLEAAMRWIKDEGREKKNLTIDTNEWRLLERERNVPQQRNGSDCGMFSIYAADYLSDDLPMEYNQDEMAENRLRVGAAILRGQLTY
jgi:hypothetical protein